MDANEGALQEGLARIGQGDHAGALESFAKVDPSNRKLHAKAIAQIGRIHMLEGKQAEAELELRRSLSMQAMPDPQSLYFLGECFFYQRKWDQAEEALRDCIVREPKYTDAYIRLGMVLKEQGRKAEAMRSFELAIVNDQKAVVARFQLAQMCVEQENFQRALSQLHVVKELASNYAPAFVLQGDLFGRIGDHRQAIVEYLKVVQMGRADAGLYWRLGRAFMAVKDRRQALKAFEEAIHLDARMWPAYFHAAQLRDEFQHYQKAMDHYRALLEVDEYRAAAKEAIERLRRHLASVPGGETPQGGAEDGPVTFVSPPVTTKVAATHSLEAVQQRLTNRLGEGPRTAPLGKTGAIDTQKWQVAEPAVAPAPQAAPTPRAPAPTYAGPDVVEQVSAALRSGALGEVMSVLRNSSKEEIAGSLKARVQPLLDQVKEQVKGQTGALKEQGRQVKEQVNQVKDQVKQVKELGQEVQKAGTNKLIPTVQDILKKFPPSKKPHQ